MCCVQFINIQGHWFNSAHIIEMAAYSKVDGAGGIRMMFTNGVDGQVGHYDTKEEAAEALLGIVTNANEDGRCLAEGQGET